MILKKLYQATFILSACLINEISGASFSNVYFERETSPVRYYGYDSVYPSIARPELAQINTLPPSISTYVDPCASPCVVSSDLYGPSVTAVNPSASVLAYNTPQYTSVPVVFASAKEDSPGYEYSYVVYDDTTGDHKAQREKSDGSVVRGEYSFLQPDGYVREVQYVADDVKGFNAIVKNYLPVTLQGKRRHEVKELKDTTPPCHETKSEALKVASHENSDGKHVVNIHVIHGSDHDHGNNHEHIHDHESDYSHGTEHSHEHGSEHVQEIEHTRSHSHEAQHEQVHSHEDNHEQTQSHEPEHENEHESEHNHTLTPTHDYEHESEHSHEHGRETKHNQKHKYGSTEHSKEKMVKSSDQSQSEEESKEVGEESKEKQKKKSKAESNETSKEKSKEKHNKNTEENSSEESLESNKEKHGKKTKYNKSKESHKKKSKESSEEESSEESEEDSKEKPHKKSKSDKHKKKSKNESNEDSHEESSVEKLGYSKHREIHELMRPGQDVLVPYNDIIRCVQAALRRTNGMPAALREEPSPLSYIVLNKPC